MQLNSLIRFADSEQNIDSDYLSNDGAKRG